LIAAVIFPLVWPLQYKATASIQVRSVKPSFISEGRPRARHEYEMFVNTQFALMRTPIVLDKVLESPEVARLPVVIKQKDKRAWLAQKLRVKRIESSEIVQISVKTNDENASEQIVNAVVDAYFTVIEDADRQIDAFMLSNLQGEKRKLSLVAQQLQDSIRQKTRQAAAQGTVAENEENAERAGNVLDTTFDQAQLERINKTRDRIDDQMFAIKAEQRAPGQIVPLTRAIASIPNRGKQAVVAGMVGFVVFFFLPLIVCSMCCRRNAD